MGLVVNMLIIQSAKPIGHCRRKSCSNQDLFRDIVQGGLSRGVCRIGQANLRSHCIQPNRLKEDPFVGIRLIPAAIWVKVGFIPFGNHVKPPVILQVQIMCLNGSFEFEAF